VLFFRSDLGRLDSAYPQPVGSGGLWVAKTTQFKRIAKRNEQDANEICIGQYVRWWLSEH